MGRALVRWVVSSTVVAALCVQAAGCDEDPINIPYLIEAGVINFDAASFPKGAEGGADGSKLPPPPPPPNPPPPQDAGIDAAVPPCGNGKINPGETCNPASSTTCPQTCVTVQCQKYKVQNSGTCQAACVPDTLIAACTSGDGCCPGTCNANSDTDCAATCGNGVVESGELCDQNCPSSCPASAQNACQKYNLQGGGTCQAQCVPLALETQCLNGDSCCPNGCNATNDNDCAAVCGNGVTEPGELCDGNNCPSSCPASAQNACQKYDLQGTGCQAQCVARPLETQCLNGDSCCPVGCNDNNDKDCPAFCGNGVTEPGELCDGNNCPSSCPPNPQDMCFKFDLTGGGTCQALCVARPRETQCINDDSCCPGGCNANTDNNCLPSCGNGVTEPPELCDGNNCPLDCPPNPQDLCFKFDLTAAGTCQAVCTARPRETLCLNGDGCCPGGCNANTDDDCKPVCGNDVTEAPELCDGINCPLTCPPNPQDACQKYALQNGGTCQAMCSGPTVETACMNNDGCCPATGLCNANNDNDCGAVCGNNVVEAGETCDLPASCRPCPVKPYPGYCYDTGSANTCNLRCGAPVLTCGPSGDSCCPYAAATGCGNGADSDCAGNSWQSVKIADVYLGGGCQILRIGGIVGGGSYDVTTCAPGKKQAGYGDSDITAIMDTAAGVAAPFAYAPEINNNNCTAANSLPLLAGWYCKNSVGDRTASCAAPSPGGFQAIQTATGFDVTICPGPGPVTPILTCPIGTKECFSPPWNMPVYVFYNAPSAPTFVSLTPVVIIQ